MPKFLHATSKILVGIVLILLAAPATYPQADDPQIAVMSEAIANLHSADKEVRANAVLVFAQAGYDERKVEPLISVLDDPDDEIRIMSATALGFLKDRRAIGPLVALLKDKNTMVQARAASALGNIGDVEAVEPLLAELAVAKLGIQFHIIEALGMLDDPRAVMPLFNLIRTDAGGYALKALGKSAVVPMCEILTRAPAASAERWYALSVLERIADERAIDSLVSVLGVAESAIGMTAANTLARRIGKPAVETLIAALADRDPQVRANAVLALGQINDDCALEMVVERITDEAAIIRRQAVESLGNLVKANRQVKDERISDALLVAMRDKEPSIRNAAITFLAPVERDDVLQALVNALADPATSAAASIAVGNRKDVRALPFLLLALRGDDPIMAGRAATTLTIIGEPAVEGLISVLTDKNKEFPLREMRRREQNATFPSFHCGNEPPPPVLDPRVLAAHSLGAIGDERARKPLAAAATDKAIWLRDAALAALTWLDRQK